MSDEPPFVHTVFVIGAGASKEVGLPVGSDLKKEIADALNIRIDHQQLATGDQLIFDALRRRAHDTKTDVNAYRNASVLIANALETAISIDHALDTHAANDKAVTCGKIAIVRRILNAEKRSRLYVDPSNINNTIFFPKIDDTWFNRFFRTLNEDCRFEDLPARLQSTAIIVLNYDRCIEHYLFHAIRKHYAVTADEATQVLRNLYIHHPYGTVGSLPWSAEGGQAIAFGKDPTGSELISLSGGIRTFTEEIRDPSDDLDTARSKIARCRRLVFLGFAFHRMNLNLLIPRGRAGSGPAIYATATGFSGVDREEIRLDVARRTGYAVGHVPEDSVRVRNDKTCAELFDEYRLGLSFIDPTQPTQLT